MRGISLTIAVLLCIKQITSETDLVMLVELFRHGSRRELWELPGSKVMYPDSNTGLGDLTNPGYRAEYLLGRAIRKKYDDFLPSTFSQDVYEVYTSNLNRTIESANSQLLGIFDIGTGGNIENDKKYFYEPPIKDFNITFSGKEALPNRIQLTPANNAYIGSNWIFEAGADCPKLGKKIQKEVSRIYQAYNSTFAALYETLLKNNYDPRYYFGKPYYWIGDAGSMCDYIFTRIWNVQETFDPLLKTQCEYLLAFGDYANSATTDIKNIFLAKMITIMSNKLADKAAGNLEQLKMLLFAGHDSNIAAMLSLFRPNNYECLAAEFADKYPPTPNKTSVNAVPPIDCIETVMFTANFIIELHKYRDNGKYEVRLLYNNEALPLFDNSSNIMELDSFLKYISGPTTVNFDNECGAKYSNNKKTLYMLLSISIVCIIAVIILLIAYSVLKKKTYGLKLTNHIGEYLVAPPK